MSASGALTLALSRAAGEGNTFPTRSAKTLETLSLSVLLNQFRHQGSPAGLMTGAEAGAVVAVKVFMKRDQVAPVRIILEFLRTAENRAPAMFIPHEYSRQPLGDFPGDLP